MADDGKRNITLDRFLVQCQDRCPVASGELTRVIEQMGVVGKIISGYVRRAALEGLMGLTGKTNIQNEKVQKLDELGNAIFVDSFDYVDIVGAVVSEELEHPVISASQGRFGKYVVLIDPIDGSSNLDVDCCCGSIFSVRRIIDSIESTILQPGTKQVAAGYLMYGPSTHLVYTAGDGVHLFVLDERIGEFILLHQGMRMPAEGRLISANWGNYGKWPRPVRAFADSLVAADGGPYSLRYSGALVADLHQILHRGGIYFYPEEQEKPRGKLRLLYECAPLAMLAEQAGGGATTGTMRVMDVQPDGIHQRIPFAIGSLREIGNYEKPFLVRGSDREDADRE
jgi:fructose-1,6-bisphosphatase I